MDVLTTEQRRRNMSRIRSKNTTPEIRVRSMLHKLGRRFSLHNKSLIGRPDIVLRKDKKVIFVHGCFWHMHRCKYGAVTPKTNSEFWFIKRMKNKDRDVLVNRILKKQGWKILVIWECQLRQQNKVNNILKIFAHN